MARNSREGLYDHDRIRVDARRKNDPERTAGVRGIHRGMDGKVIGWYGADGQAFGTKVRSQSTTAGTDPASSTAAAAPPPNSLGGGLSRWYAMNPNAMSADERLWRENSYIRRKDPERYPAKPPVPSGGAAGQAGASPAVPAPPVNSLGSGLSRWYAMNPNAMSADERLWRENSYIRRKDPERYSAKRGGVAAAPTGQAKNGSEGLVGLSYGTNIGPPTSPAGTDKGPQVVAPGGNTTERVSSPGSQGKLGSSSSGVGLSGIMNRATRALKSYGESLAAGAGKPGFGVPGTRKIKVPKDEIKVIL